MKYTYRSAITDVVLDLTCPWTSVSSMIPPATLIFHEDGRNIRFALCNSEEIKICS